jgi:glutathione S-transferase
MAGLYRADASLAASPKGTVPVLQTADGMVIDESSAIMRWVLHVRGFANGSRDWPTRRSCRSSGSPPRPIVRGSTLSRQLA